MFNCGPGVAGDEATLGMRSEDNYIKETTQRSEEAREEWSRRVAEVVAIANRL